MSPTSRSFSAERSQQKEEKKGSKSTLNSADPGGGGGSSNSMGKQSSTSSLSSSAANSQSPDKEPTWINDIFQGILTSETRCLNCETVTSKDEDFFDLSIDVEQNTSITSCLRNFSTTETLCSDNKFKCDSCSTYQEAHVSFYQRYYQYIYHIIYYQYLWFLCCTHFLSA